jgi:hypothetical protein
MVPLRGQKWNLIAGLRFLCYKHGRPNAAALKTIEEENTSTVEEILAEARKLPPEAQRQLASALLTGAGPRNKEEDVRAALAIVEETSGSIKGLDRDTIIRLAEDEELSGY